MQVVILGSGSPLPDPNRAGPATLVRTSAGDLLFDCGRGVLLRAAAAATGAAAFQAVLLTHLHSDHVCDLNDVITSRWVTSFVPNPLSVVGPVGTANHVAVTEAMLAVDIGYRLAHHADLTWRPDTVATEVEDGTALELDGVRVLCAPTNHAPVHPTVGYRIEDGGRAVVVAGDTVPCEGLDRLCDGADVLVHTVVRREVIEASGLARLIDVLDYHSDVRDAARTATKGGVGTLVLTHLFPAPAPGTEEEWIALAREEFSGEVVMAADLTTVEAGG